MNNKISKSNLNIFNNYTKLKNINNANNKLPSLINNNNNKNDETLSVSLSNPNLKNKNQIYKMKLSSKMISFTDYNKRNSNGLKMAKSLNTSKHFKEKPKVKLEKEKEKLQNLVNFFKELDDDNPKTMYDIKNPKTLENKKLNNEISKTFTKCYKISRHQQKIDVIKLNTWDEDNLESFYGNTNIIYKYLVNYYIKKNNKNKLNELEYFKRIIDSNGNFVDNILKSTGTNNKIIQNFKEQLNIEQGSILHNII